MSNSETPCTAVCQASLTFIISWSLLKLMSIESVMPSNHLILCLPFLFLPSIFFFFFFWVRDFFYWAPKITADYDYSHQIKGHFLLGRKAMTNLNILKSRDINLPTKVHIFKAIAFLVVSHRPQRRLSTKEPTPPNCGVAKDSRMSHGPPGDQNSQL